MTFRAPRATGLSLLLLSASLAAPETTPAAESQPFSWDVRSDSWVATDGLGRSLPAQGETGPPRPQRFVGIFYFLWHGEHIQGGPYDITQILRQDPAAMQKRESPLWGPMHAPHHWGQSIFGYYLSDDESVLRKHAQMLSDAGVDAIFFDVSNQVTYRPYYEALLRVFREAQQQGARPPQIAFLCPFGDPVRVVERLYRELYKPGLYPELWFRWEGKPLILADPRRIQQRSANAEPATLELLDFFTFRKPQPDYFRGPTGPDMWSWLEVYPQHLFTNHLGQPEQMSVGVAQNAVNGRLGCMSEPGAHGRSFHNGAEDSRPGAVRLGLNVAEQWQRARAIDPSFIFITGWNEWIAGRFDEFNHVRLPVMFVDQFDEEHSRDIEPMKGGHGDDYYYQMVDQIRRYKGVRALESIRARPIHIDGQFADWEGVEPEFRDTRGDPVRRDHRGWGTDVRYVNRSGRQDIVAAKVSRDNDDVYFYARTQGRLLPPPATNWMLLFLDVDANPRTGWLGYDFVVNRVAPSATEASLERHVRGGYQWEPVGRVRLGVGTNALELALPWPLLDRTAGATQTIDFKWADNIEQTGDWSDFTLNGDAAPNDRFNYRAVLSPL